MLVVLLDAAAVFGQDPAFERVITDQPNYSANFLSGLGLADGGSMMVGTGLVNTSDSLALIQAVGVYRFDRLGDLIWSQAYPEPNLLNERYREPHAAKLVLVDDRAYVLVVRNQVSGSTAYPMTLRQIDLLTGTELSIVTLEADGLRDSLGPPVAFAIIDDAAVLIRDDYARDPSPTANTVQVFGLDDGQLRASLPKEGYYDENATAWPAAGLVFVAGAEPFGIYADGDTLTFPSSIIRSPESGVQPFVALGDRAVYAATQGAAGNDLFVTASIDGSDIVTTQAALPFPNAQVNAYDLSAWGLDSFAMTVRGRGFSGGVFLFDADGSGGRKLLGDTWLLTPNSFDGPKYAVLSEHTSAPPQRRVLARNIWSGDPVGLVNYVNRDTVALPIPLSSPRPEFFDEILTATQAGPDEILGYQSLPDIGRAWIKFDRSGDSLALPPGASIPRYLFNPKLTRLTDGRGYLLHEIGSDFYQAMAYLYDDELVLQDSVEMSILGEAFSGTRNHPDGGVIYAIRHRDSIVIRHLTADCAIRELGTFDPPAFVTGNISVHGMEVGPEGEIALSLSSTLVRDPDAELTVHGSNGEILLGPMLLSEARNNHRLAWSPSGSLLIYERVGGSYREFRPEPDGSLQLALTGQLSTDSVGVVNLLYVSEDELLVSYTDLAPGGAPYATLARYRIPEREFRVIHVESEESYAYRLELSEEGKVMQPVYLSAGFRAVVLSQGSISSNNEPRLIDDAGLVARSPFTDAIHFSFEGRRPRPEVVVAKLFDVGGRLVHQAVAEPFADGLYRLQTPNELPSGTYILQLDDRATLCVKQ